MGGHPTGRCFGVETTAADVVLLKGETIHQTILKARYSKHHDPRLYLPEGIPLLSLFACHSPRTKRLTSLF